MQTPFTLTSPAFFQKGKIPSQYTCDGDRYLSPPLEITGIPFGTKSLALIMDDPDIPAEIKKIRGVDVVTHWVVFNIPPETSTLAEGAPVGVAGVNTRGEARYMGPCPPPEYEPKEHRYFFTLYALSAVLDLSEGATKEQVLEAIAPVLIEKTELMGVYARG